MGIPPGLILRRACHFYASACMPRGQFAKEICRGISALLRTAGIAPLPQAMPRINHAQRWISAAHVADELQLGIRVLVRVAVRLSGPAGKGRRTSVPTPLPEIDV